MFHHITLHQSLLKSTFLDPELVFQNVFSKSCCAEKNVDLNEPKQGQNFSENSGKIG